MTFNYTNNIPLGNNNPSVDQPNMQTNTNSISSIIAVDHVGFNATNGGTHKQVTLTNESTPAIPAGTNGVFYANLAAGNSWPFWNNGLVNYQLVGVANANAVNGQIFAAGGLILKWSNNATPSSGSFASGSASGTVNFVAAFPGACYNVFTLPFYNSGAGAPSGTATVSVDTVTLSASSFQWTFTSSSSKYTGFYWLAIGA